MEEVENNASPVHDGGENYIQN